MRLLNVAVFILAAMLAVGAIIGLAFQLVGFLIAGGIILGASIWISASLRTRT